SLSASIMILTCLVEALAEPELCYVLDAVLFTYGIILTVLYCLPFRTKILIPTPTSVSSASLQGLSTQNQETYETLQTKPN
uniref:High affinity immunoglobulin epsilon receptor subunit gamma n=1 Tax=Chrysemys picta bellii TaxID=8478 RepID=A0A8C3FR30_CHRPI